MFQPHSNYWLNNKFEFYKILRNLDKAYYSDKYNMYILTRYHDVYFALNNPDIFSSSKGNLIVENPHRFGRTLGASDNPIHNSYKEIIKEAYSKDNIDRVINSLNTSIKETFTPNNLDVSKASKEICAFVVAEILNIPYDKYFIKNLIIDIQDTSMQALANSNSREAHDKFTNLINKLLDNKVEATGPGIYAEYVKANNPRIMSLFTGPTISGVSSLIGAMQFLTLDLYKNNIIPSILYDRTLVAKAVNESLRYNASTGRFSRTIIQPIKIHNVELKPGDRVALCLESANRDVNVFESPETFDINRDTSKSLGFGRGVHACIALAISKKCMEVYLNNLLDYYGNYTVEPVEQLDFVITASGNDDMITNLRIIG